MSLWSSPISSRMVELLHGQMISGHLAALAWDGYIDGWIMVIAVLASISAALLGCFLLLRKMSLTSDAISHSVLPGIAIAYLITGDRHAWPMFVGAVVVGLLTVWLTETLSKVGAVDEGASTGIVFTGFFALGLILIVQAADRVDLDANCVLFGDIEIAPLDTIQTPLGEFPRIALVLSGVLLLNVLFVVGFYNYLKLATFDRQLADSLGIPTRTLFYALASLVAVTCVASFEAVGSVLVVSMFVVPAAAAVLCSKQLHLMLWTSVVFAALSGVFGHLGAIFLPPIFGFSSTSTSAMIGLAAGTILFLAILFNPTSGLVKRLVQRIRVGETILEDDILALLFRDAEQGRTSRDVVSIRRFLLVPIWRIRWSLWKLRIRRWVESTDEGYRLTNLGEQQAQSIVRSHRLWELFLADTGVHPDRLHPQAESLEHFTNTRLREQLDSATNQPTEDPHGRRIPPEMG